ncbi:MAG: FMN-binding protein [Fastidiosipila sp.]|nr:FMN-binding protein [Fastidiosipila sp.]
MAKNEAKIPNTKNKTKFIERGFMPALILTIIAIVSVAMLALTESITADARAEQQQFLADTNKRIIFSEADSFPAEKLDNAGASLPDGHVIDLSGDESVIDAVYLVEEDEEIVGLLISANPLGYSGRVGLLLGYDLEGNFVNLTVDAQSQTAGLGTKIATEEFTRQFNDFSARDTLTTSPDQGFQVDVISGATISSNAVIKGINAANTAVKQMLGLE